MKKTAAPVEVLGKDTTIPGQLNPDWLPREEVVRILGISKSTIERMVLSRKLRSKTTPRPGRKPERLYKAEDVRSIKGDKEEREQQALESLQRLSQQRKEAADERAEHNVVKDAVRTTVKNLTPAGGNGFHASKFQDLLMRSLGAKGGPLQADGTTQFWLSVEEAAILSGLSPSYLMGIVETGKVAAVKGGPHGAWRIQRKSLEAFAG
jgi:hypothetical protein